MKITPYTSQDAALLACQALLAPRPENDAGLVVALDDHMRALAGLGGADLLALAEALRVRLPVQPGGHSALSVLLHIRLALEERLVALGGRRKSTRGAAPHKEVGNAPEQAQDG